MKRQNTWAWWLVGAIIIVAVVGAFWLKDAQPNNSAADGDEQGSGDENNEPAVSFDFLLPDDWSFTDNAMEDIQTLTPGQQITFGIVEDPTDDTHAYFASYAPDPNDDEKVLLSVYNYNTKTYEFERIFRRSYGTDFPGLREGATPVFHVVGYDEGKLIILAQDADDSPGPCTEVLVLGRENEDIAREMLAMNLESPYDLMVPYEIPEEVYSAALEKQDSCVNQLQ